ncbi:hypothetical protein [Labedella populi]|uniref:hypothetical protein n=1 Tax=Labedella populi TaxID=2498850 RepID=UPI001407A2F2|nr:hypothetical protein [Labedella populi]
MISPLPFVIGASVQFFRLRSATDGYDRPLSPISSVTGALLLNVSGAPTTDR